MYTRKGMSLLIMFALLVSAFALALPLFARADGETGYTVTLLPGEHGLGDQIVYDSANGISTESWNLVGNYQFYYDTNLNGDVVLAFKLDPKVCPFTAEQGYLFDAWDNSSHYIWLNDQDTVITAQWKDDLSFVYGPIEGIPRANGGTLYLGGIRWRVIGQSDYAWLLISADVLGDEMGWDASVNFCNTVYNSDFSVLEQGTVIPTSKQDADYTTNNNGAFYSADLSTALLFLPSAAEVEYYFPDSTDRSSSRSWWLRSRSADITSNRGIIGSNGIILCNYVDYIYNHVGARPAFQFNPFNVLFESFAEDGKPSADVGFATYTAPTAAADRKLTLLDGDRNGFAASAAKSTVAPGGSLSVTYSGANTGTGETVSAMLCGADGAALLYASLTSAGSGTWDMTIPADLAEGIYTLKVFSEQQNGDGETDYASAMVSIPLTIFCPHTVTVSSEPEAGGTAAASGESFFPGETVTLTAASNPGWQFEGWQVISGEVTVADGSFTMPAEDVTIKAIFSRAALAYLVEGGGTQTVAAENWAEVGGTSWTTGWYAVLSDTEITDRVSVSGDVSLILCDEAALYVPSGITIPSGSSLTVYAQSTGSKMGSLTVDAPPNTCAGIGGGGMRQASGTLTIHGGSIYAKPGTFSAAIGAGYQGTSANITITGGSVHAVSGNNAAAIGGGQMGGNYATGDFSITITGGSVHAEKTTNLGAGIGAGYGTASGALNITITGGTVTANGSSNFQAIGGPSGHGGTITLGEMTVRSTYTQDSPVLSTERENVCRGASVYLEPCGHSYTDGVCVWCGAERVLPEFGTPDFTLPSDLTVIGMEAFEGGGMTIVDIHENCVYIGDHAFRNCLSLTQIRIPANCELGEGVFDGCTKVYVFGASGSPAETYCNDPAHSNCVFVPDTGN